MAHSQEWLGRAVMLPKERWKPLEGPSSVYDVLCLAERPISVGGPAGGADDGTDGDDAAGYPVRRSCPCFSHCPLWCFPTKNSADIVYQRLWQETLHEVFVEAHHADRGDFDVLRGESFDQDEVSNTPGLTFWYALSWTVFVSNLCHSLCLLSVYVFAARLRLRLALSVALLFCVASMAYQHYMKKVLMHWLPVFQHRRGKKTLITCWLFDEQTTVLKLEDGPFSSNDCCIVFIKRSWVLTMFSIPSTAAWFLDALVTGQTSTTWDERAETAFRRSWEQVYDIGPFVSRLGYPGCLLVFLVVTAAWSLTLSLGFLLGQLHHINSLAKHTHDKDKPPLDEVLGKAWVNQSRVLAFLSASSHVGTCTYLSSIFQQLALAWRGAVKVEYLPAWVNIAMIVSSVLARGPHLWLQVSALGLSMELEGLDRLSIVIRSASILASWAVLGMTTCRAALTDDVKPCRAVPARLLSLFSGGLLVATAIRYVKTLECPTNNFSLRTFECEEWIY